jgi:uncharacterized repeat protein (TIGR03803 family)
MKKCIRNLSIISALAAFLGSLMAGRVTAQTFTILHSFTGLSSSAPYGNNDGANPSAGLILSGNTLYGTTKGGGSGGNGAVFKMNRDGTGITNLHSFAAGSGPFSNITNIDGASPNGLILYGNTLYGTTTSGGSSGNGTVFALNTDGTGFTSLHTFTATPDVWPYTNSDGTSPFAGLVITNGTLYGTAWLGGSHANGTVFTVKTNGTSFKTLYSFTAPAANPFTNSDGANPYSLILSGETLYGTAGGGGNPRYAGGSTGDGTVFAVNTDGTGFRTVYTFSASATNFSGIATNNDGACPTAGLILSGNAVYGTASLGGIANCGTVFAVNTDGSGLRTLHTFTNGSDGAFPYAELVLFGNTLYGTTSQSGSSGGGTVFAINADGSGFKTLYALAAGSVGARPSALLIANSILYGTTIVGGSQSNGTIFSLSLPSSNPPQLGLIPSGPNVVLTWRTNTTGTTGFALQSAPNLGPTAFWSSNSTLPVVINGQNTVTNPISGTQQFFRLSQ